VLISQRVAKDINFLKPIIDYKGSKDNLFRMRLDIIHSVKFIVGRELLNHTVDNKEFLDRLFKNGTGEVAANKRLGLYNGYCRLPFPGIVIENDTVLLLLISKKPLCWNVYSVYPDGSVGPSYVLIELSDDGGDIKVFVEYFMSDEVIRKIYGDEETIRKKDKMKNSSSILFLVVMEILLFMNVRNVKQTKYVPTKKENTCVPKPLQSKYTYHILDLFKQKNTYTSLEEIKNDLCKPRAATALRRAVLVRGHFKQRRTGLFFWDFHTRNKHNAETHGIVDKDYRVHSPCESH